MTHELRLVVSHEDWEAYHSIRERVLWEARGHIGTYDRSHPDDHQAEHFPFLFTYGDEPVGVVRIDIDAPLAWFRRVAVREHLQRRGHGRHMLELAAEFARGRGCRHVRSNVDPAAVGFYLKLGFEHSADRTGGTSVPMERPL